MRIPVQRIDILLRSLLEEDEEAEMGTHALYGDGVTQSRHQQEDYSGRESIRCRGCLSITFS
jgi:hypothetical protein